MDALREFGDWSRGTFLDDISSTFGADLPFIDEPNDELDLDSLRDELLEEYPHGCDWTGISNAMLIHSPNQVVYVSIDNPNHTKLARDILPREAWPSTRPTARPNPRAMSFKFPWTSELSTLPGTLLPCCGGKTSRGRNSSALRPCPPSSRSWTAGTPFKCGPASRRPSTVPAGHSTRESGTGPIASYRKRMPPPTVARPQARPVFLVPVAYLRPPASRSRDAASVRGRPDRFPCAIGAADGPAPPVEDRPTVRTPPTRRCP